MLNDDPPPGTKVQFLRDISTRTRVAKAFDTGVLIAAKQKYAFDNPDDQFLVEYLGERFMVSRRDILNV